ncbi:hypothetical protein SBA3_1010027 [Candidatus Sulfopaludibacter sp. SbA3]|nr:hypothetical protein SBA3_1010027 [Candidatus Sulfopaludibacter sp. SbA3]
MQTNKSLYLNYLLKFPPGSPKIEWYYLN